MTDFGIARSLDAVGETETGTVLGTSHYIAPEQARGERVDAQTDVYSFGVVLYELLAGEVPYPGDNFLTVAMKHVNEPGAERARPAAGCAAAARVAGRALHGEGARPSGRPRWTRSSASSRPCLAELDAKDGRRGDDDRQPKPAPCGRRRARRRGRRERSPLLAVLLGRARCSLPRSAAILLAARRRRRSGGGGRRAGASSAASRLRPGRRRRRGARASASGRDRRRSGDLLDDARRYQTSLTRKSGVGLVLDAGEPRELSQIAVTTRHAGVHSRDPGGRLAGRPFETVAASKTVECERRRGTSTAPRRGTTSSGSPTLDRRAHINEVDGPLLVLEAGAPLVALERELDQAVEQLARTGCRTPRTAARRRSSR